MPELFDLITGSESGALIAGTLVYPANTTELAEKRINQMFADETMKHFRENAQKLYISQSLPWYTNMLIILIFIFVMSSLTYMCLSKKLDAKQGYEKSVDNVALHIK